MFDQYYYYYCVLCPRKMIGVMGTWWWSDNCVHGHYLAPCCDPAPATDTGRPNQTQQPFYWSLVHSPCPGPPAPYCLSQILGHFYWLWSVCTIYQTHFLSEYTLVRFQCNVWRTLVSFYTILPVILFPNTNTVDLLRQEQAGNLNNNQCLNVIIVDLCNRWKF